MNKTETMAVVGLALLASLAGCSKKTNTTEINVGLTSTSSSYEAVNVQIKEVWIKVTKENTGWFFLKTEANALDLNTLSTGVESILAKGSIPISEIREVRFILGNSNTLVKQGVSYPLAIASALEGNAISLRIQRPLNKENEKVIFSMDVKASISNPSNNEYVLNPVIRLK